MVVFVIEGVIQIVVGMLFIDVLIVDFVKSIVEYGVDSFIVVELWSWFYQVLKMNFKMGELLDVQMSIKILVENIVDVVLKEQVEYLCYYFLQCQIDR